MPVLSSGRGVGEERNLARVLDRHGDVALMPRAASGDATCADLAAVGDELAQQVDVLVVDRLDALLAETTSLGLDHL